MVQDIVHCWTIGCACIDEGQKGVEREKRKAMVKMWKHIQMMIMKEKRNSDEEANHQ